MKPLHSIFFDSFLGFSKVLKNHRKQEHRIVFTNGCFDLFHDGHRHLLNQCLTHGDIVIVGLNSDDSVRELKGNDRPLQDLTTRAESLSQCRAVSYVVSFDDDSPTELIKSIMPDVYIKGGDYCAASLPEYDLLQEIDAEVIFIPRIPDLSTSQIVKNLGKPD